MLEINSILKVVDDKDFIFDGVVRYLGRDLQDNAILIRMDVDEPLNRTRRIRSPFSIKFKPLTEAINKKVVLTNQFFDTGLSAILKKIMDKKIHKKMKENHSLMEPLLLDDDVLFSSFYRGIKFKEHADERGVNVRTISRLFNRYYWGGQSIFFLAPAIHKKGGSGKIQKEGTKRRGRWCKSIENIYEKEKPISQVCGYEVVDKLQKGYRKYVLKGNLTVQEAFEQTLIDDFSIEKKIEIINDQPIDKIIYLPENKLPTLRLFRYYGEKLESIEGKRTKHPRHKRSKKVKLPRRGTARDNVPGPGYRFEIDATKFQVQLVSRYGRRRRVGTATVYFICDVWSGAITGYCVSLESAGWPLAARALRNCFIDKGELLNRLGLPYTSSKWPCKEIPQRLVGDRGEMVSDKAKTVLEWGTILEITASNRGDRKGTIESIINTAKFAHFNDLPGIFAKFPKRGEIDGKNTAALNIYELEQVIVLIIMDINNAPATNILHEMLRDTNKDISRIELYRWGLKNRAGFTFKMSPQEVITWLLTKGKASVRDNGIYFKGQTFNCERLYENQYLQRAADNGTFGIEIGYDELMADIIYYFDEALEKWIPAFNLDEEIRRMKYAYFELESYYLDLQDARKITKKKNIQQRLQTKKKLKKIRKEAEERSTEENRGYSNSQKKKDIKLHRDIDRTGSRVAETEKTIRESAYHIMNAEEQKSTREISNSYLADKEKYEDEIADMGSESWKKKAKKFSE